MFREFVINELRPFAPQGGFLRVKENYDSHHSSQLKLEIKSRGFSPETLKAYLYHNKDFLNHLKGKLSLDTDQDVKEYISFIKENNSSSYNSLALSAIKFFNKTVLNNDLDIRQNQSLPSILSREEISSLLSSVSSLKHSLLLQIMYGCGLRTSEVVRLKIHDIDLKKNVINVKNRSIPIPKRLIPKLEFFTQNSIDPFNPYLFQTKFGDKKHHITRNTAYIILKNAAERAGIKKHISPHTLRHSYATHLLESGVNIKLIQHLIGYVSNQPQLYSFASMEVLKNIETPLDRL